MKIIQIMNNLPYGNALTNDALNIQKILRKAECTTQLFANHIDSKLPRGSAQPFSKLGKLSPDDIVIFHPNMRSERFTYQVSRLPCRKIIRHHVFTPAEFSFLYSNDVESAVCNGNHSIRNTANKFEYILAPSPFDVREMRSLGFEDHSYGIVPYLIEPKDYLDRMDASLDIVSKYSDGRTNILYVSRIVPNKKQEDAIAAFAQYKRHFNENSRLIFVGGVEYKRYSESLKQYCKALGLTENDVIFAGKVPFSELLAFYKVADIFLFSSEHEGFGITLIEAMLFQIPIIAYNYTAIPDTLGGCGILLEQKDPLLTAFWMDRIMRDFTLKRDLISNYARVINLYNFSSVSDALLSSLGMYIKSFLNQLPRREYVSAVHILSKFDTMMGGGILE